MPGLYLIIAGLVFGKFYSVQSSPVTHVCHYKNGKYYSGQTIDISPCGTLRCKDDGKIFLYNKLLKNSNWTCTSSSFCDYEGKMYRPGVNIASTSCGELQCRGSIQDGAYMLLDGNHVKNGWECIITLPPLPPPCYYNGKSLHPFGESIDIISGKLVCKMGRLLLNGKDVSDIWKCNEGKCSYKAQTYCVGQVVDISPCGKLTCNNGGQLYLDTDPVKNSSWICTRNSFCDYKDKFYRPGTDIAATSCGKLQCRGSIQDGAYMLLDGNHVQNGWECIITLPPLPPPCYYNGKSLHPFGESIDTPYGKLECKMGRLYLDGIYVTSDILVGR